MALGKKTGGGKRKGIQNKATKDLKLMISAALSKAGGESYLVRQAEANPVAFMTLLGKIIPRDVNNNHAGTVQIVLDKLDQNA